MAYTDSQGAYHPFHRNILLSLNDFREAVAGDVLAIAGNGGILASDTTPTLTGTSTGISQQISWATGNVDQILCQMSLPSDFDGRDDVLLDLWVNSGTTDAATIAVTSSWDGGATVTDSADDAATLSATTHLITATISRDDIPDRASYVSIALVPPTHATNAIQLIAARIRCNVRNTA